eukprot:CAMPEP_0168333540 /NCGR_PEP_ID=MMETSP0213-20121227/9670_1 /TAXON_ID=151035 /ORGANISM="Euplotes harpa, Strain FSP1.4" /LENGTH=203 /DNA_ID=CAMNT_0008337887 /DNA_START=48 /DNA_END=659 /DNA_ORIENTATION=+
MSGRREGHKAGKGSDEGVEGMGAEGVCGVNGLCAPRLRYITFTNEMLNSESPDMNFDIHLPPPAISSVNSSRRQSRDYSEENWSSNSFSSEGTPESSFSLYSNDASSLYDSSDDEDNKFELCQLGASDNLSDSFLAQMHISHPQKAVIGEGFVLPQAADISCGHVLRPNGQKFNGFKAEKSKSHPGSILNFLQMNAKPYKVYS